MNSVHELIAFFVQRGSCIESIYLRKEKQRHFCQDTYFRSPPRWNSKYLEVRLSMNRDVHFWSLSGNVYFPNLKSQIGGIRKRQPNHRDFLL